MTHRQPPALSAEERSTILALISLGQNPTTSAHNLEAARVLDLAPIKLRPYLAHRMQQALSGTLSTAVRTQLEEIERNACLIQLLRQHQLSRLLTALEQHAVPFVLLKGAVVGPLVYPSPHLRPVSDIDVWVAPGTLQQAGRALAAIGLTREVGNRFQATDRSRQDRPEQFVVELHDPPISMACLLPERLASMFARASHVRCAGNKPARALQPEDLLTHLVLHLARHHVFDAGLVPLLDIARVVEHWHTTWEWERLQREWIDDGTEVWMTFTLRLAHRLLAAPIPSWLIDDPILPDETMAQTLATEQLWDGMVKLPPGRHYLLPMPWSRRLAIVARRLSVYYWRSDYMVERTPMEVVRDAWNRLRVDVRKRLPELADRALRGGWQRSSSQRSVEILESRKQLERLLRDAQPSRPITDAAARMVPA